MKRVVSGEILILLLTSMLTLTFNNQLAKINETIHITSTPDFSIKASPTSLRILLDDFDRSAITVTSTDGFNQPVQLTASGAAILKWTFEVAPTISGTLAVGPDGTIYYGSYNNKLYAINPNGVPKWIYDVGDYITSSCTVGPDGTIYFLSYYNDELRAINPDGALKWSYNTSWTFTGWCSSQRPAIGLDGTIYCGYYGVCALYPNGTLSWEIKWSQSTSFPAIGPDGTIYVNVHGCNLSAINPDGTLKWHYFTGGNVIGGYLPCQPAISPDGTIYFASYDGKLSALNPNGTLKWSYELGVTPHSNPVVASNGDVYLGSWEGKLYALSSNGTLKWSFNIADRITSPDIAEDGTLYCGSGSGELYALSPNGKLVWSFKAGGGISSPPAVGPDSTIYFGCEDGKLYAVGPLEITATINPDRITPSPDGSAASTLTVSVNATAPLGRYTLLVVGTSGTLTHNVAITLEIVATRLYINPSEFSLMPGESITLIATLTDWHREPVPGKTISWDISRDPPLNGILKTNNSLTDYAGRAFAIYTAGDVPCETFVIVSAEVHELQLESWGSVQGKILPSPPLIIPLLIFGVFLLLTRTSPHKNLRRALITILILGFSFVLSYPLGFSSHFSSLVLSAKVPAWFLAGLLFLSIVAIAFSILEQSSKYGLIFGICCSMGIILGLLLPNPESSMAYASIDAILIALSPTIVEGLIFSGILAVFARIGPRIDIARIRHSVKNAEKKYNEGNLLQAARLYAKALSTGLKTNYKDVKALNQGYVRLTRKIIYQTIFRGKEEDKKTLQFAIELQKTLKNKLLSASHEANQIGTLDFLLEKAKNNDLDFIVNDALNDKAFLESFLEKTSRSEIMITDLAKELEYSVEATKKLLEKGIEKYEIEGFLTFDKEKFISKHHLARVLSERIEEDNSKNNQCHAASKRNEVG
jgi:outer membrane protein assembly factor BamB